MLEYSSSVVAFVDGTIVARAWHQGSPLINIFKIRAFITISTHSIISLNLKFVDSDDSERRRLFLCQAFRSDLSSGIAESDYYLRTFDTLFIYSSLFLEVASTLP